MKFLHTADLHLDSAFCTATPTEAAARRERQRQVLKKIFRTATEEGCDMLLISGDLFDTPFVTPETRELCLSLFSDFGRPVIIAPGNHDPYVDGSLYKSSALPENVYVFTSPELRYFDFPELGVSVAGYAFLSSALTKNPLEEPVSDRRNEGTMLLCAHAELDAPTSRYAPVMSADIVRHGFTYAALGHIHNVPATEKSIRYCGFPEGRSFDEQGDGGVLIVTVSDGGVSAERKIISEIRYLTRELSIDGLCTKEDIETAVTEEIRRTVCEGQRTHLRLELTGTVSVDALPDLASLERSEYEGIASLELTDGTLCLPDAGFLERDTTLRGELYRALRGKLTSDETAERRCALRALRIGLAAIDGRNFSDGGRDENN